MTVKYFTLNISFLFAFRILLFVGLLGINNVNAQYTHDDYEYDDYDSYYDNHESDNNVYGGRKLYKQSKREEDLYNRSQFENQPGQGTFNLNLGIGRKYKNQYQEPQDLDKSSRNRPEPESFKNYDPTREPGSIGQNPEKPTDDLPGDSEEDNKRNESPPPPPDEPDVPVDTAIPLLISGGIIIVASRFYIKKSVD